MPPEVLDALGPWGQLGLIVGCVALIVTGLTRGWLRPASSVERENKHLEARLLDRDDTIKELKVTNSILLETNQTQAKSINELLEVGRTQNAVLNALPQAGVNQ